jgi:hypothetical protein
MTSWMPRVEDILLRHFGSNINQAFGSDYFADVWALPNLGSAVEAQLIE